MNNFWVGQKVVCVSGGFRIRHGEVLPQKGEIYTIRTINHGQINPDNTYMRFVEIVNPVINYGFDIAEAQFTALAFRPLVARKTDISIFTRILDRANGRERVS